jgi:hypothetical protein
MEKLPNDVSKYIAPAKKNKEVDIQQAFNNDEPLTEVGFTLGGNPEVNCPKCPTKLEDGSDNPNCFAKKVKFSTTVGVIEKYFIKTGLDGFMFDPWGPRSEGLQDRYARLQGKPIWTFSEVNKRAFEFYKTFLQTRNRAWKINAEREVNNA